jgi:hypothetical protein
MGYTGKAAQTFSYPFFPDVTGVKQGSASLGAPQRRSFHEGKHSSISDYLQQFVFGSVSPAYPMATRSRKLMRRH